MSDPAAFNAASDRIGTPEDRAACFVRSWSLDEAQYAIAFMGLRESLEGQFQLAEARARALAFQAAVEVVEAEVNSYIPINPDRYADGGAVHVCRSRLASKIREREGSGG